MEIKKVFEIDRGDIVSIVGSGGKTTLMFLLAREVSCNNKVLVTTTTKIYVPHINQFDFICCNTGKYTLYNNLKCNGIYVYGSFVNNERKLIGIEPYILEKQLKYFDYVFVEADGSKKKPIKGWKANEPVILNNTSKTIGIVPIDVLGKIVNEDNVHGLEEFMSITGSNLGDIINEHHIISLVFNKKGLFKNSRGQRILFINRLDKDRDIFTSQKLIQNISKVNRGYIYKIISGSLKEGYLK
ncbi:putative selenium-dependent hydroxylase accessory protein YqeC [Clostridium tyrobutyricum]|jgi:probable selenium-dependent hydroxylase accessory protein YqeC|uniref:Accessory protein YqeC in selenium-dependent molybdenum hydroxylase maturation n=1 Tax=Clostridium tyrobutyricum DIVETGP TaxID=1408889 RepID=W6NLJ0_CLOTY|nr:selenium cofactor biosynthesis protein YqeC [Clostridium tyrobutyricum]AND84603.1 hypothetical protein CTK_C13420 [Clostridium tyrobutyricum]ANP69209.1 hydroxylase [Clostridium tyrobutyricum]MBR9648673.1 putative selenium-dependent hydroxylase accessory protein YqeC [Clostridium tyrobutyricum]MBV4415588.1 putative selenium-dependent hydroxylase accessory protein YqeC [Clostridium tyrobutyricum]MBV4421331.1 putative selenium-dependent hydroxylase accessory protein YqeC [Clostridium tyrobutyr